MVDFKEGDAGNIVRGSYKGKAGIFKEKIGKKLKMCSVFIPIDGKSVSIWQSSIELVVVSPSDTVTLSHADFQQMAEQLQQQQAALEELMISMKQLSIKFNSVKKD